MEAHCVFSYLKMIFLNSTGVMRPFTPALFSSSWDLSFWISNIQIFSALNCPRENEGRACAVLSHNASTKSYSGKNLFCESVHICCNVYVIWVIRRSMYDQMRECKLKHFISWRITHSSECYYYLEVQEGQRNYVRQTHHLFACFYQTSFWKNTIFLSMGRVH